MNESTYGSATLIKAARAAAEAFLAVLDEDGQAPAPAKQATSPQKPGDELIEYDPLTDEPPFPPDPSLSASQAAQRLASLTYLGAVARINASEGRGATSKEITQYAKKAGYTDGKAVNGWNSRPNSMRSIDNIDGARYLNAAAHDALPKLEAELGIKLKGDITPLAIPEH